MATPPQPTQTTGKSLFSLHYLETRLPDHAEWREDGQAIVDVVRTLWQKAHQLGASWNEAQTEPARLRPLHRRGQRAFQGQLASEYEASLARLLLKRRLSVTDRLIDRVIYQLYGLTDEEIAIVEGRSDENRDA